jgi:hypothetical protein
MRIILILLAIAAIFALVQSQRHNCQFGQEGWFSCVLGRSGDVKPATDTTPAPAPETPAPAPVTPEPVTPEPEPMPETPAPEMTPEPETPAPESPEPETQTPN